MFRSELGQMAQDNLMLKKDLDNLNTCIVKIKELIHAYNEFELYMFKV